MVTTWEDYRAFDKVQINQGSVLDPNLNVLVSDEISKDIQKNMPCCMMFRDGTVLIDTKRKCRTKEKKRNRVK